MNNTEKRILSATEDFVRASMDSNDPAHDMLHVERVVKLARKLLTDNPSADPFLTELIALLHDMSDRKLSSNTDADVLRGFLRSVTLDADKVEFVINGISRISYSKYPRPDSNNPLEVQIVQDADRLDAMGAVGIARTFSYGGAHNVPFYSKEGGNCTIAHFDEKLLLLKDLLNTEAAHKLAAERHLFLEEFYRRFHEEIQ